MFVRSLQDLLEWWVGLNPAVAPVVAPLTAVLSPRGRWLGRCSSSSLLWGPSSTPSDSKWCHFHPQHCLLHGCIVSVVKFVDNNCIICKTKLKINIIYIFTFFKYEKYFGSDLKVRTLDPRKAFTLGTPWPIVFLTSHKCLYIQGINLLVCIYFREAYYFRAVLIFWVTGFLL